MTTPTYLEVLNPEQREAVLHTGKPLLILAGAGSGKTRVITTKIAWLIRERGVEPWSILAVTFTNKAAREMAERARLIDERAGDAMLRTFHSFGAWFLRRNGALLGLNSGFVIYDDDDTIALLATLMENSSRAEVKQIAHGIARAKDYFLAPDDPELDLINHHREFRPLYKRYEERLAQIGNVDFGDLIKKPVEILRAFPEVAGRFRDRFRVIMVDEYQDSNVAQFELLKELCGPETYICVVGDDDQSIYRFRGAEVKNILEFPDRFPGADIVRLERNYRSTAPILQVASSVVDHNTSRLGKTLRAERGTGKTPVLAFLPDQDAEASFCAELIEKSVKGVGKSAVHDAAPKRALYSDWAILYRTNAQSLGFETELLRRRIPYRVVGSLKFYEREEIKDALALLSFLVNPRDEVAFRRVVNKPTRGVGAASVDRIVAAVTGADMGEGFDAVDMADVADASDISDVSDTAQGANLITAAQRIMPSLSAKARAGVGSFINTIEEARSVLDYHDDKDADKKGVGTVGVGTIHTEDDSPEDSSPKSKKKKKAVKGEDLRAGEGLSVCVVKIIKGSGIDEYHLAHDEIAGNQRISNLQELANAASLYPATREGLLEFLEHIELDRSMEQAEGDDNAVTLITLHNTKGLEFRRVIMTGIEQGIFPRDDKDGDDLEEERRLFYVGATRAMDELYLCSCGMRRMFGRTMPAEPSLFLRELDKSAIKIIGSAPYGFAASGKTGDRGGSYGGRTIGTAGGAVPNSKGAAAKISAGQWQVGARLFHDDHGYGAVIDIRDSDEGPVVKVRFDTGNELHFLSLHQSSRFTKIGGED
ncbi:DNA helicase [Spirochaetia bacterium]|nr:DNA helicase [Spirochaetia bacterium]